MALVGIPVAWKGATNGDFTCLHVLGMGFPESPVGDRMLCKTISPSLETFKQQLDRHLLEMLEEGFLLQAGVGPDEDQDWEPSLFSGAGCGPRGFSRERPAPTQLQALGAERRDVTNEGNQGRGKQLHVPPFFDIVGKHTQNTIATWS